MASSLINSRQIDGEIMETVTDFILGGSEITTNGDCSHEIKRHLLLGRKALINLDGILKSIDITLLTNFCLVKTMVFPVFMYGCERLDYKVSWEPKNCGFWTVVLKKTLGSPLDLKEIQSVHPKRSQSWIFIRAADAEAEISILWPPNVKNWLIWKGTDAGKDWRQEEKGMTEDELVGWLHWRSGHEFESALGVGDEQGSLGIAFNAVGQSQTQLSNCTELKYMHTHTYLYIHAFLWVHIWNMQIFTHMCTNILSIKNILYIFFVAQVLPNVLEKINYFFNKIGKMLENFFNIRLMPFVSIILRKKA